MNEKRELKNIIYYYSIYKTLYKKKFIFIYIDFTFTYVRAA